MLKCSITISTRLEIYSVLCNIQIVVCATVSLQTMQFRNSCENEIEKSEHSHRETDLVTQSTESWKI